jgi:hypothetical protein
MPSANVRRHARAIIVLGALAGLFASDHARADQAPPINAIANPLDNQRHPIAREGSASRSGAGAPGASGSWWLGTAGIALALAVCGGISVAARRYLPARPGTGALRVVGRASLSPRQTVYLLEVGERVLILGAGPQGPPSLLGELTGPGTAGPPGPTVPLSGRFDRRVGDDE